VSLARRASRPLQLAARQWQAPARDRPRGAARLAHAAPAAGAAPAPAPARAPSRARSSGREPTASYLKHLREGKPGAVAPSTAQVRSDLRYWRPAASVAVTSRDSRLGRDLTSMFGPPTLQDRSVLAWRPVRMPRAIGNAPVGTRNG
jgi:hypothetical protein